MTETSLQAKTRRLAEQLAAYERLAVALSGGVDSALLLAEAADVLGDNLLAVTARSPIHPPQEVDDAVRIAKILGVSHLVIDSDEMRQPAFLANPPERCYICKKHVFGGLLERVRKRGFKHLAHGANAEDLDDYRPGLKAARELGVVAPLMDVGFTKNEIREAAQRRGLPVWDKPAMACLATRFPYWTPITEKQVDQVREAEAVLAKEGFSGCRVRHHGDVARIEVPRERLSELIAAPLRQRVVDALRRIGFLHVCADLEGYTAGSMNRRLNRAVNDTSPNPASALPPVDADAHRRMP